MPFMGQTTGAWIEASIQLGFLGFLARNDRRVLGLIYPATLVALGTAVGVHALIQFLAGSPYP